MPTFPESDAVKAMIEEARREGRILTENGVRPPDVPAGAKKGRSNREAVEAGKRFERDVLAAARAGGWLVAHFGPSRTVRKDGSVRYRTAARADGKGFPDLVLVRDRVIFAELKGESNSLEPGQRAWRDRLKAAGQEWYVWRPADLDTIRGILT